MLNLASNALECDALMNQALTFVGRNFHLDSCPPNPQRHRKQDTNPAIRKEELEKEGLDHALDQLDRQVVPVKPATYASLLQQCSRGRALSHGRRLHARIIEAGLQGDRFLGNLLVQMYGKCGSIEDAREAFEKIAKLNGYSWNIMIVAFVENGHLQDAVDTFERMPRHYLGSCNAMITAYAQYGYLEDAEVLFDKMTEKDVVTWNAMIAAYAQAGHGKEALQMLRTMDCEGVKADCVTMVSALDACSDSKLLAEGKKIHGRAAEFFFSEIKVGNALIDMYGKSREIENAKEVFDSMPGQDVVSWTAMISAYARCGHLLHARNLFNIMPKRSTITWNAMITAYSQRGYITGALEIFHMMQEENVTPDEASLVTVLDACATAGALEEGRAIHAIVEGTGFKSNLKVGNALITMYTKCKRVEDAGKFFDEMPQRNVITWTALISAYAQRGHGKEALKMLQRMDLDGVEPNEVTFLSVLDACASVAALAEGRLVHNRSIDTGYFAADVKVGNAVINVYGKCGKIQAARGVFEEMPCTNLISWNAVIAAYAHNSHWEEALELFEVMALEGVHPDEITFTSIISVCVHAGRGSECLNHFGSISTDYHISPDATHYVCMVDLLGRLGQLKEAEELIHGMPFEPTVVVWTILLSACRMHGNMGRAARAAEHAIILDYEDSGLYVLLSNIYFDVGRVEDAETLRKAIAGGAKHEVAATLLSRWKEEHGIAPTVALTAS